ncbi:MAG: M28 family peptidase, partial [Candidatus Eremiobacterota bacterium]
MAEGVDPEVLRTAVQRLSGPRNRLDHPEAIRTVEDSLAGELADAGWTVERFPFRVGGRLLDLATNLTPDQHRRLAGCEGVNLRAFRAKGGSGVLVGAHYDTLSQTPGADDNASGVVALLELARRLPEGAPVELALFDMEEWNLLGSRTFVAAGLAPPGGAVILESIGYFSDRPDSQHLPPGLAVLYPGLYLRMRRRRFRGDFLLAVHRRGAGHLLRPLLRELGELGAEMRDPVDLPGLGPLL